MKAKIHFFFLMNNSFNGAIFIDYFMLRNIEKLRKRRESDVTSNENFETAYICCFFHALISTHADRYIIFMWTYQRSQEFSRLTAAPQALSLKAHRWFVHAMNENNSSDVR